MKLTCVLSELNLSIDQCQNIRKGDEPHNINKKKTVRPS